jgi:hypothetical protein
MVTPTSAQDKRVSQEQLDWLAVGGPEQGITHWEKKLARELLALRQAQKAAKVEYRLDRSNARGIFPGVPFPGEHYVRTVAEQVMSDPHKTFTGCSIVRITTTEEIIEERKADG